MESTGDTAIRECPNCGRPLDGFPHAGDPCDVCGARTDGMGDPGKVKRHLRRGALAGPDYTTDDEGRPRDVYSGEPLDL